jgi:hypothetical protein
VSNIPEIEPKALINELKQICALVKDIKEDRILEENSPELHWTFE